MVVSPLRKTSPNVKLREDIFTVRSCLVLSQAVTVPIALDVCPLTVSPTEKEEALETFGGVPDTFVFLVINTLTGRFNVGALTKPVPNFLTSTPLTEPSPDGDQVKNVAPVPCVFTIVSVALAPEVPPVITSPTLNVPDAFAMLIFPERRTATLAVKLV